MPQNGQTYFKNLAVNAARFLKCLTILGHYALKGQRRFLFKKIENVNMEWLSMFSQTLLTRKS